MVLGTATELTAVATSCELYPSADELSAVRGLAIPSQNLTAGLGYNTIHRFTAGGVATFQVNPFCLANPVRHETKPSLVGGFGDGQGSLEGPASKERATGHGEAGVRVVPGVPKKSIHVAV